MRGEKEAIAGVRSENNTIENENVESWTKSDDFSLGEAFSPRGKNAEGPRYLVG